MQVPRLCLVREDSHSPKAPPLARWDDVNARGLPVALAWQANAMELSHHPSTRWNNARVELLPFHDGKHQVKCHFSCLIQSRSHVTGWDGGRKVGKREPLIYSVSIQRYVQYVLVRSFGERLLSWRGQLRAVDSAMRRNARYDSVGEIQLKAWDLFSDDRDSAQ